MKKVMLILMLFLTATQVGCGLLLEIPDRRNYQKELTNYYAHVQEMQRHFSEINQLMVNRGYLTADELKEVFDSMFYKEPYWNNYESTDVGYTYQATISREALGILINAVDKDFLPFKAMFYLALQKGNYDEAELIRRTWFNCLQRILKIFDEYSSPSASKMKIQYQLQKLNIIGLTDPTLVMLRKEMAIALENKQWDDSQKIQNLILSRTNELRPPQTQTIAGSSSQTTVVVQQPSEQYIKVENVPRYGAEDVGRAISLLQGKGGSLTSEEAGALKMLDIIMER